jgi:alpha-mannosidase
MKEKGMHPRTVLAGMILFALTAHAQSPVDRLVESLEFLSKGSISTWKYSTDFRENPTAAGFDDAAWDTLRLGQSISPDSCWIRKEIVLPERLLGQPLKGAVRFLVSVDDYGDLWVNGELKGRFPWDGEFTLTDNARPGQRFVLAIKAFNTGGPLRLLRARLAADISAALERDIERFTTGLRVGKKLLSFDTYQTNARRKTDPGIDHSSVNRDERTRLGALLDSTAAAVDADALARGDIAAFRTSLAVARERLRPVGAFAKKFTLYFTANAHIDAAWLWRSKETVEVCRNTFRSVLNMMDARPEFTYTQSSAAYYEWMERLDPALFAGMKRRIADGRWEVVGGMWVEPDCNLPGGESWARHLLYGKRYFRDRFGVDVKIGWNPDSFGYNWNMPQFYRNAGIDAFITQKIGWNETNVFPYRLFWWESPDGSRILSCFPFDYVNTVDDPYRLTDWLRQYEANTGVRKMPVLFGVGDHGGGPSLEMLARIDSLQTLDIYPTIEHGTTAAYLSWLRDQDLSAIPVWRDELYLEYHQGTFTTQARVKEANRRSEELLTNAEKFSVVAARSGRPYPQSALTDAWKLVLFNQFHDILPGSSIREVYGDAMEQYAEARSIGETELGDALHYIAARVNTSSARKGIPLLVFNPAGWVRSDLVCVDLGRDRPGTYTVSGPDGKPVPSQVVRKDRYTRQLLFHASGVPPLGYSLYTLRETAETAPPTSVHATDRTMENRFFRVVIDQDSGWVSSITDLRNNREVLRGNGNVLHLLEDKPAAWDAWNVGLTGTRFPTRLRSIEIIEQGPVRAIIRVEHDYLKPGTKKDFPTEDFPSSFFTQDVIIYDGIDRIDFRTAADWWEDRTMLKVAFPVSVADTAATFEIPYGTIRRSTQLLTSTQQAQVEVPAQRWADLSPGGYGVSLLNRAKYGYDVKGNVMRLSLLRSPQWPDPTADRGKHMIEYALYPHADTWKEAGTVRKAWEYNNPLLPVLTDVHTGALPPSRSFLSVTPAAVVLTTVKRAEDADAWIVQCYESEGRNADAVLTFAESPHEVTVCNFMEEAGDRVPVRGTSVSLNIGPGSVTTLRVKF